jgi:HAD superfamily hydrolase (TIGR01450 family)
VNRRAYLIDIEGVLVVDKSYRPVPGAVAWLNGLAARGIAWRLVSNNTTHRPDDLVAALVGAGFAVTGQHLVGALTTGVALLRREGWRRLGWLGAGAIRPWLEAQGFTLVAPGDRTCDAVVLGVAPDLRLSQLDQALRWLQRGAALVCLHRNRFWLDAEGRPRLGPGALAAALEAAAPGSPALTAGKPEPAVYGEALESLGVNAGEALFISDDPFTDLVGARRLGLATVFVLSGKYRDASVLADLPPDQQPDLIIARPDQLPEEPA